MSSFEEILIKPKTTLSCCQSLFPCLYQTPLSPVSPFFPNKIIQPPLPAYSDQKTSTMSTFTTNLTDNQKTPIYIENRETMKSQENQEIEAKNLKFSSFFPKTTHPIENHAINQLMIWSTSDNKRHIMLKITEKRFNIPKKPGFSFPKQGISSEDHEKTPVFEVIDYITSRMKCSTVLDLSNGIGEYVIPWLSKTDNIISIFNNIKQMEATNENLKKCNGVYQANLICIPENYIHRFKGKFDAVFLNPYSFFNDFCSKTMNSNEIKRFFRRIRNFSCNFAFFIHKNTENLENLIDLLSCSSGKYPKTAWEIEKIYYANKLKFLYIYQGDISNITLEEEIELLKKNFYKEKQSIDLEYNLKIHNMLFYLNNTLGNNVILKLIMVAREKFKENAVLSIFDVFMKILRKSGILQKNYRKSGSLISSLNKNSKICTKPSLFFNSSNIINNNAHIMSIDDSAGNDASYKSDRFSALINSDDFRVSYEEEPEKRNQSDDEYVLSDYSVNYSSNEEEEKDNIEDDVNNENDEFEITFEQKLSIKVNRKLSLKEEKDHKKLEKSLSAFDNNNKDF